jgi:hypothetical protein
MNPRIEKKLSKRLYKTAPDIFGEKPWIATESDGHYVGGFNPDQYKGDIAVIGGEPDYWGEGTDVYTYWHYWAANWYWLVDWIPTFPQGHEFASFPDKSGVKETTKNLLKWAKELQDKIGVTKK